MDNNFICQNFLEVSQDTFTGRPEPFNIIIGGPPFVRVQELFRQNPEKIKGYKRKFKAASSQFDLYMLFIEKAIELMDHMDNISRYFQSPKIISSTVNNGLSFFFEDQGILCGGSTVIIEQHKTDISSYLLLAVLNSSVFRKWANLKIPSLGDGWKSLQIGIMREFPIVLKNNENEKGVREIVDEACDLMSKFYIIEDREKKLSVIDQKVCSLYNLT